MNSTDALAALMALPPEERLSVGQQLTQSALAAGAEPDEATFDDGTLSEDVKAELDAIVKALDEGTMKTYTWEEVEADLREHLRIKRLERERMAS